MFNKIWMWVIIVPIFPLWKKPNSENKKNHPTIPGNKKNLQASSFGQTKKMPLVKRPGKSPLTPKTSTWNRPQGTRGSASEKQCQMARKRMHLQNYFVGLHWSRLATHGNTILLVTSEATQFLAGIVNLENSSGLMNSFESVIKGDYTFMSFCRGWAHGQEVWETKANKYINKSQ